MKSKREKEFYNRLDNSPVTVNVLSQEEHTQCFYMIKKLRQIDTAEYDIENIINDINTLFISKFDYHRPVDFYFKLWDKVSFESDAFLSLLQALEEDYWLISGNKKNYLSLY